MEEKLYSKRTISNEFVKQKKIKKKKWIVFILKGWVQEIWRQKIYQNVLSKETKRSPKKKEIPKNKKRRGKE